MTNHPINAHAMATERRRGSAGALEITHVSDGHVVWSVQGAKATAARGAEQVNRSTVFVQVVEHPERKLIIKRALAANHYFEYCEEVGCDVWEVLGRIEGALREPMGLWLPDIMKPAGTSTYVQGVEVPKDFQGSVPEGFDVVDLDACKMMVFQGPPFEDRDFSDAIASLWDAINAYQPELYGFAWADDVAPRFQLAPLGYRGYVEGRPVRAVDSTATHT